MAAMQTTADTPDVRARFVKNVLGRGNYSTEAAVIADLNRHTQRLSYYATVNGSDTPYGFYRLDAFGRRAWIRNERQGVAIERRKSQEG